MRILLDLQGCQSQSSRQRGIGRYSMAFARALLHKGVAHEFHVLLNGAFPATIAAIEGELAGLLPADRLHVFHAPQGCADNRTPQRWRTRASAAIRRCAIQQVQPDIVHVSSLFEGLVDDCVAEIDPALDGVPASVTVYDFIPYIHAARYLAAPAARDWYMRRLESMKRAALLLGISQSACSEAEAVMPDRAGRVVNVSSAANPLTFFPAAPGDAARRLGLARPFVLYTGGIDWRKNVEGLIEAFAALPRPLRERHQLAIVCSVEPSARRHLLSCARKAGLRRDDVVLTGFVSDEELADLYRGCELFVFPSVHEGFGLPALEAMMCGAAVIGSNTSSIPEVIGRGDATFDPRSPQQIAALMQRALEDEAFRASLKTHATAQAARFSWEACAGKALEAMEQLHAQRPMPRVRKPAARPRLAMVAPLPPAASGIADYNAELVPALREHYEIELVHHQPQVQLPPALAHLPLHDAAAFRQQAARYDRVLYQFGNSAYHAHMFALLRDVPGTVVLHDFFLGAPLDWLEQHGGVADAFRQALLRSHGAQALEFDREHGRAEAVARYPVNRFVAERAEGVIVHSHISIAAAQRWYGPGSAREWRRVPHLHALPPSVDRVRARAQLGLAADDFVVCSFGHLTPNKLPHRLLDAWLASSLAHDARCKLILVGENAAPGYGDELMQQAAAAGGGRIALTGYASRDDYERHLAAADLAVQLRAMSRGESSAAVLDCLAWGVPLIANAHGATAEYPVDVLRLLPDEFTDAQLVAALEQLRADEDERRRLADAARTHVAKRHDPAAVAREYRDAIEAFAARPQHAAYWNAIAAIGTLGPAPERELEAAAVALEATWQRPAA
jgi:glycosyltransferase involved in cell wall biosynthesis